MKNTVQSVLDQIYKTHGVENVAISTSIRFEFSNILYIEKNKPWSPDDHPTHNRFMYANIITNNKPAQLDTEASIYKIFHNKERTSFRSHVLKFGDALYINSQMEGEVIGYEN
ncbi:MAG: hypothetical protein HC836_39380 [Richelia sp. RM2_1_2]|nr:hypothetical protein [Richelia sp. RM2_1_2]